MPKKEPLRRCLGCYESKPKRDLIRVVRNQDGDVSLDKTGKMNGRGAYICKSKSCLEKAVKSKRIEKELNVSISNDLYESLRLEIEE